MLNFILIIINIPFYILGYIAGFIVRPCMVGFHHGFRGIQLAAYREEVNRLNKLIEENDGKLVE
jgi:hypothetical protein